MSNTSYKFDEIVKLKRNRPKTFVYIVFALQNYIEKMTPK